MTSHWQGKRYTVVAPKDGPHFYRLLTRVPAHADDFQSDFSRAKQRFEGEDYCRHLGVSVWEDLEGAIDDAVDQNERLVGKALPPWRFVAEVGLQWPMGHACARTGKSAGHHTLWGDPYELALSVRQIYTIEGEEVEV